MIPCVDESLQVCFYDNLSGNCFYNSGYGKLGFDDAKDEMIRLEELEAAKKEVEKVTGEKPISQKMFKAI